MSEPTARSPAAESPSPATSNGPRDASETAVPPLPDLAGLDERVTAELRARHEALTAASETALAWRNMAYAMHASDLRERSRVFYQGALERDDTHAMTWHLAGLLEQALGEDREAAAHFERAARLAPDNAAPLWRLGMIRLNEGRVEAETTDLFRRAVRLAPDAAGARIGLARALIELGEDEEALDVLAPLRDTQQANTGYAHLLSSGAFQRLGWTDDAEASRTRALGARALLSDPWEQSLLALRAGRSADLTRATALARGGQLEGAIEILEALRANDPTDAAVRTNLAAFYRAAGRLRDSEAEARTALTHAPDHPDAHYNLGATLTEAARAAPEDGRAPMIEAAHRHLERALTLNPGNWEAHQTQGDLYLVQRSLDHAEAAYRRAAVAAPAEAEPRHRRAVVLLHMGRHEDAAASAREATQRRPGDPECWLALANAEHLAGRPSEAAEALRRAEAIRPGDPRIAQLRARISSSPPGSSPPGSSPPGSSPPGASPTGP